MDCLYRLDYNLSKAAYRIFPLHCFSFERVFARYISRLLRPLNIKDYNYPTEQKESDYVWVFWAQGEDSMPRLVKACVASIRKYRGGKNVVLVNMENIKEYVEIPKIFYDKLDKGQLSYTKFSNIVRFSLLKEYGGWWIDATCFLTSPLPLSVKFYTIRQPYNDSQISRFRWATFIWYLPKRHPLSSFVIDAHTLYWQQNDTVIEYLLLDYIIDNFYHRHKEFRSEVDALKESQPDCYFFQWSEAKSVFNKERWETITRRTHIFKTSYKIGIEQAPLGSFCQKILLE